jgi:hypothetical protein
VFLCLRNFQTYLITTTKLLILLPLLLILLLLLLLKVLQSCQYIYFFFLVCSRTSFSRKKALLMAFVSIVSLIDKGLNNQRGSSDSRLEPSLLTIVGMCTKSSGVTHKYCPVNPAVRIGIWF